MINRPFHLQDAQDLTPLTSELSATPRSLTDRMSQIRARVVTNELSFLKEWGRVNPGLIVLLWVLRRVLGAPH